MPSESNSKYIQNFIVTCPACQANSRLREEITEADLPAVLTCPECHEYWNWESWPTLPKIPPVAGLAWWYIVKHAQAEEERSKDKNSIGTEQPPKRTQAEFEADSGKGVDIFATEVPDAAAKRPVPFFRTAKYLGRNTRILFGVVSRLHEQIEFFQNSILAFFEEKGYWSKRIAQGYKKKYMQEFLTLPLTALPCPCDDETAASYARWILAPKFFDPGFGFHPTHSAGCRLELLNSYSRLYFPVESLTEQLGVPPKLDIKVAGNKLIGGTVQLSWKDIPGIATDHDHTDSMASVYIKHPNLTRVWLAQHGVRPWQARPIEKPELEYEEPLDLITQEKLYTNAWWKFQKHGRLGVFWKDVMAARKFAALACYMLRGLTVVFTADQQSRMAWDSLYENFATRNRDSRLAFFKNGDPVSWEAVQRVKSIVVDMNSRPNTETGERSVIDAAVLENLMSYNGRLILLCDDPIQDFDTHNIWAGYVHGLTGFGVFDKANHECWKGASIRDDRIRRLMGQMLSTGKDKP
jgi:hypothetical protein